MNTPPTQCFGGFPELCTAQHASPGAHSSFIQSICPHFIVFLPKGTRKIGEGVQEGQCCGGSSEPREGAAGNAEHVPQARTGPARPGGLAGRCSFQKQRQEGLSMTDILRICTDFKKPSHSQNNKHVSTPSDFLILVLLFRLSPKQPLIRVFPAS